MIVMYLCLEMVMTVLRSEWMGTVSQIEQFLDYRIDPPLKRKTPMQVN